MGDSVRRPSGRLAVILSELLANKVNEVTGRPYTYAEVASAIKARTAELPEEDRAGRDISATYVWQLVTGRRWNPTIRHLESLADFFGYPPSYFLDPEAWAELQDEIEMISAMRDVDIRSIAYRARGLSPRALRSVRAVIDHARSLEGLPDRGEQVDELGTDGKHEAEHGPRNA